MSRETREVVRYIKRQVIRIMPNRAKERGKQRERARERVNDPDFNNFISSTRTCFIRENEKRGKREEEELKYKGYFIG